jgi:hypothetical protein
MKEKRIGNRKLRMTILEGVERERHQKEKCILENQRMVGLRRGWSFQ